MCLAIPAKVIEKAGDQATVDLHGSRLEISTITLPETVVGDWVLVHAGFAIQRLDEEEAAATFAVLKDIERADAAARAEGPDHVDARD